MNFIIGVVLFYALLCAVMYFAQRTMIYFPDKSKPALIEGAQLVDVKSSDGQQIQSWFIQGEDSTKPAIIYYHGNAGNFSHRIHKAIHYIQAGYSVLLAEYRGYGGNGGEITEQGIYKDARAQLEWLINEKGYTENQIVIYGESIGSGPAVQMATEYQAKALVLETPFSSLVELASRLYFLLPVKLILKDKYLNINKISDVYYPVFVVHGDLDSTIPIASAKRLFEKANQPKQFLEIKGGNHNDLYSFHAYKNVLEFLAGLEQKNTDNEEE